MSNATAANALETIPSATALAKVLRPPYRAGPLALVDLEHRASGDPPGRRASPSAASGGATTSYRSE
ncbi:hypothetical protein [Actinoplanes sp. TFC3]|uniref:hypothetical protein n=1 Tax=Actinoplanes sp. TFC3 TaxID=1710355 RepID=UPI0008330D9E|nr:hypothetical protein [Actinoplanes sp. TFC3]